VLLPRIDTVMSMLRMLSEAAEGCDPEDLCFNMIDGSWTGVVVEFIIAVYSFVGIAIVADEHLAPSLETLCHRLSLSEDVAGASFLSLGSAAPEIIIAAVSTAKSLLAGDKTAEEREKGAFAQSLGIASILGSGMMAFTLIPGLCAMAVPKPMALKRRPLARDAFFYALSLGFLYYIIDKGRADVSDGTGMLVLYAIYLSLTAAAPSMRECYRTKVLGKGAKSSPMEKGAAGGLDEELNAGGDDADDDDEEDEEPGPIKALLSLPFKPLGMLMSATCPECEVGSDTEHLYPMTMAVAFTWLALFSTALSAAITRWGVLLHVPGTAMGMFIVAVGAQIPDTVQAIAVARRGHGSMAVASAVGSQVMNILIGLGLPWTISTSAGLPITIPNEAELKTMSYLMVFCVVAYIGVLLAPSIPSWGQWGRALLGPSQGWILFGCYALVALAYILWSIFVPHGEIPNDD